MKRPLALFLAALVLALPMALAEPAPTDSEPLDETQVLERFERAWRIVDERYWDPLHRGVDWNDVRTAFEPRLANVTTDNELYALLQEMYEELGDDHSRFVPPSRVAEFQGEYGDLPCLAYFGQTDGTNADSEAEPAEGEPAIAFPAGTQLQNVTFDLLGGDIGYLRVPDLAQPGTSAAMREAVRTLQDGGATAFILDLRGNPGGRLVEMMQAAGVFTNGFLWRTITRWTLPIPYPALGSTETDAPLAVLIDGNVHSAAEGLAGALQAQGRAVTVGARTAGNVEAVLPFCLRDGSQAWIATGVLAPLVGATWEDRGVEADVASDPRDALETATQYLRGHAGH